MMTRKRIMSSSFIISDSQGEDIEVDIREKGIDDEFVMGDVNPGTDNDFIADKKKKNLPSKYKKNPKKNINNSKTFLKSSSKVGVCMSSSPAAVTKDHSSPSTSPMVMPKSSEDCIIKDPSFDGEEFTSSTPIEERQQVTSCDKLVHDHRFPPGSLVWSKLTGYPWWPSMVCNHPTEKKSSRKGEVHVMFLDTPVNRAWVSDTMIRKWGESVLRDGAGDKNWDKGVQDAEAVAGLSNEERLNTLLVNLLPSDEEWSDEEVSSGSKENKDDGKTKEPERKRIIEMDSDDSDGDEDFKPSKEDLMQVSELSDGESEHEPTLDEEPMSPVKGSKKRKMEKKPPAAKKSKLTSSPPETSLSTPVGKFASSLATFRTPSLSSPSTPLPAVCDSTKKKLSMFGASPSPGPAMLRPPRSGLPRQPMRGTYRLGGPRPLAPPLATGPRLSNVRTITPVSHRSLYTPQYSNQNIPPVVELDVSPPMSGYMHPSYPTRSDYLTPSSPPRSSSPPNSVGSNLSSLVSVAREKVLATNLKHGWVLPPGISVIRTTPSREGPSLSLPSLANSLLQLGDGEGRKRLVQYNLSENQVKALDALGVKEDAM